MKNLIYLLLLLSVLILPVSADELLAPEVSDAAREWMPENTGSFSEAFSGLIQKAIRSMRPDLIQASRVCVAVISAVMLVSILKSAGLPETVPLDMAGTVAVATVLLLNANTMIRLGADTVTQISEYGKLLLPVMTAAVAAQGAVTSSVAMYAATALFNALISGLISGLLVPTVYLYLALCTANSATGENMLKNLADLIQNAAGWILKTLLIVFTTYMSITGVVSGTTDAAALKAAKVTMSSVIPVVGGILSDAAETMLVSTGLMKNAAGVYGILAVLALFLHPFLQIGAHYLILKLTAAVCSVFGTKRITDLIDRFSAAMGLLLAMTASSCLIQLISTVCFMKGAA